MHAVLFHHPIQQFVPALATEILLGDQLNGVTRTAIEIDGVPVGSFRQSPIVLGGVTGWGRSHPSDHGRDYNGS
jgi:hypothetical protein